MHRLFVALRPPPAIRQWLLGLMGGIQGARWQTDDQLHVTLRYIGEVTTPVAEDVAVALGTIRAAPLTLRLNGVGCFDKHDRPNAVWAGVAPHEAITALHRKVDQALIRIGLPSEGRAYLPHVTLARLPRSAGPVSGFLADHAALAGAPFEIGHMLLFESHLGSEGASYDAIGRWPLRS
ncbi:RNA 2',3'-cyclic phosphodiesterase [Sphingomonas gilva]|uniref:RNA 2',3'-cyclic phosphodiesterase n=1 Tax=Sphingomonas gilva TaxID=2305907 RepID=A0A396S687_9SPHN|nr:RNA 2',3'-cyclic phosphodiesterase [Sphingomonas gilva]RHW18925.1 RNA 2',3'-cyclic phosphodiesterase [Sphingomonas gilva]